MFESTRPQFFVFQLPEAGLTLSQLEPAPAGAALIGPDGLVAAADAPARRQGVRAGQTPRAAIAFAPKLTCVPAVESPVLPWLRLCAAALSCCADFLTLFVPASPEGTAAVVGYSRPGKTFPTLFPQSATVLTGEPAFDLIADMRTAGAEEIPVPQDSPLTLPLPAGCDCPGPLMPRLLLLCRALESICPGGQVRAELTLTTESGRTTMLCADSTTEAGGTQAAARVLLTQLIRTPLTEAVTALTLNTRALTLETPAAGSLAERLRARLGAGRVMRHAGLPEGHLPALRAETGRPFGLPALMLSTPMPLHERDGAPIWEGPLTFVGEPRTVGGLAHRMARTADARYVWLQQNGDAGWSLAGLFA